MGIQMESGLAPSSADTPMQGGENNQILAQVGGVASSTDNLVKMIDDAKVYFGEGNKGLVGKLNQLTRELSILKSQLGYIETGRKGIVKRSVPIPVMFGSLLLQVGETDSTDK